MSDVMDFVRSAFPGRAVRPAGEGQLSSAFRVDDELIVRVPRHAYGIDRLRAEVELLGLIRHRVSVTLPDIVDVALDLPAGRAYVAHRVIPGSVLRPSGVLALPPDRIEMIGAQVGRFLRELHSIDPADVPAVPVHTAAEFATELRAEVEERLAPVVGDGQVSSFYRALSELEAVPDEPLVLAHTDIGGNVLVDPRGHVGVIDFGSCFVTHPAMDVASLSVLGGSLTTAAANEYPLLGAFTNEAKSVAATFLLQDALYGARQEDWPYVRAMFGLSGEP